jgi:hypothetical protein
MITVLLAERTATNQQFKTWTATGSETEPPHGKKFALWQLVRASSKH